MIEVVGVLVLVIGIVALTGGLIWAGYRWESNPERNARWAYQGQQRRAEEKQRFDAEWERLNR